MHFSSSTLIGIMFAFMGLLMSFMMITSGALHTYEGVVSSLIYVFGIVALVLVAYLLIRKFSNFGLDDKLFAVVSSRYDEALGLTECINPKVEFKLDDDVTLVCKLKEESIGTECYTLERKGFDTSESQELKVSFNETTVFDGSKVMVPASEIRRMIHFIANAKIFVPAKSKIEI